MQTAEIFSELPSPALEIVKREGNPKLSDIDHTSNHIIKKKTLILTSTIARAGEKTLNERSYGNHIKKTLIERSYGNHIKKTLISILMNGEIRGDHQRHYLIYLWLLCPALLQSLLFTESYE